MTKYYSASVGGFFDDEIIEKWKIPKDAVAITHDQLHELLDSQVDMVVRPDTNGNPVISIPPAPTSEQLGIDARAKRDTSLSKTDYIVMPDYPISPDLLAKVKAYRQLLRDITEQAGFPVVIDWPANPLEA